jgi:hypothetical protein
MRDENKVDDSRRVKQTCRVLMTWLFLSCAAFGQGTMVFDQQSSTESNFGEQGFDIQAFKPMGQSFTPSLAGVGFIRLRLGRGTFDQGATIFVNLMSGSITGAVLAATSPVTLPVGFIGTVDFLFANDVPVSPGTTYYFQPVIQSGGTFSASGGTLLYPRGNAFLQGVPVGEDLWFREGIIVPEPSTLALLLVGGGALAYVRRKSKSNG